jgi:imidazolonepropionase-like amidohydrolase
VKAFVHARIIDGLSAALGPHTAILVGDDGRIVAVGDDGLARPQTAEIIDCRGRVVYPGLIDMHSHLREESLASIVRSGVTTVRDVGNDLDYVLGLRARTAAGALAGPRIHCAGPLLDGQRPMWPDMSVPVADPDEAAAAIAKLSVAGVDGIKLYMGITHELLAPIVTAAHDRGLPVTAHLGAATCLEAARAGIDSLEHACQALYPAVVPPAEFLPWDQRWTLGQSRYWAGYYRGWAQVQPDSAPVIDVLRELRDRDVALDPTLLVNQRIVDWAVDRDSLRHLESAVDPAVSQGWVAKAEWFVADWSAQDVTTARDALQIVAAVVAQFAALGGTIVVGTDAPFSFLVPGASLHEELELLVSAGLSSGQVLHAATDAAARRLGWEADVGAIAPGRLADLVVCSGDPLRSISESAQIAAVYRGGEPVYVEPTGSSGAGGERR